MRIISAIIALTLGIASITNAQQFDYQGTIIGQTVDALAYQHADMDEDGDQDILIGGHGRLVWMENDDTGKFLKEHVIWKVVDFDPRQIEVADVTGDQKLDVLARFNNGSETVFLFVNDGQGGFSAPVEVYSNSYMEEFTLSDLDGDTDLDMLFVIGDPIDVLRIYENDGAGNFSFVTFINGFGDGLNTAVCGNVGGSALPDIVASVLVQDEVVWFENLGGLTFSTVNMVSTDHDYPRQLAIADLNGDFDNDIIVSSFLDEELAWFENLGTGSFSSQNILVNASEWPEFIAADMDGDNDIDLITNTGTDEVMVLHTNDGSANFAAPVQISNRDPHYYFDVFDVNNDTYVDVFYSPFGSPYRTSSYFVPNNNNQGFNSDEFLTYGLNECEAFHYADFDGDGWQDILSSSSTDNTVFWSRNLGDGTFDVPVIITDTVQRVFSVLAVDLDNDTDMDVLALARGYTGGSNNNLVHVLENDGSGNFSFATHLGLGTNGGTQAPRFGFVNTVDIDGNLYQDVMVATHDNSIRRIYQFLNYGNLSFSSISDPIQLFSEVQFFEFVDLNGDTALDCVYLRDLSGEIMYRENDGNGNFPTIEELYLPANIATYSKGMSLKVVDMEGDGDKDLLVSVRQNYSTTSQSTMKLLYMLNDGDANFNSSVEVEGAYGIAWDTEVADLDGDNDLDVVANDMYGISWFRNDGGGNYVRLIIDSVTDGSIIQGDVVSNRSLHLVDLDNDSDLDVVYSPIIGSVDKRYIRWAKNGAVDCAVLPTVASSSSTAVCEEIPVTLTATGGSTFTWNNGLSDQSSHVVLPEQTTTYVVTVSDGADCTYTDSVTVEILPAPIPTVAFNYPDLETQSFDAYQWLLNGSELVGETNQTVMPASNGDYAVIVTDNSTGCSDTSAVYTMLTVDVNDNESSWRVSAINHQIHISLAENLRIARVKVIDLSGRTIVSESLDQRQTVLDINAPVGIYLVRLETVIGVDAFKVWLH